MTTPGGALTALVNTFPLAPDGSKLFPILPGLTLEYKQRPTFSTILQRAADRSVTAISLDPFPLWEYDLAFGYISDDAQNSVQDPISNPAGMTQLQQIIGLFLACGGQRDTFLMDLSQVTKKPGDNAVDGIPIGLGDGVNLAFQLFRSVGGFLDLIDNPILSTLSITVTPPAGSANAAYSAPIATILNGLCTLSLPPETGASVTASFSWLHRMRFTSDAEEFEGIVSLLHTRGMLKLTQERNR